MITLLTKVTAEIWEHSKIATTKYEGAIFFKPLYLKVKLKLYEYEHNYNKFVVMDVYNGQLNSG